LFFRFVGGAFFLTENVFFGPAARAVFWKGFFLPIGAGFYLTENVFMGHAARAFLPSGHFASGGELFARPKSSSKTAPSGGPAGPWPHLRPSWGFPPPRPSARVAGRCAKLGACQHCRLKPPRKICLTRNPLGAIRNSLEKHPSLATLLGLSSSAPISEGRGTLCETWGVSAVLFVANRLLFSRRLHNRKQGEHDTPLLDNKHEAMKLDVRGRCW